MNFKAKIIGHKEDELGTQFIILIPEKGLKEKILKFSDGRPLESELRIDDNRTISSEQRRKIYACIRDIADYLGDVPEYYKSLLKFNYCYESGEKYFSLSDCSMDTARQFINYIIDFILANDIPLSEAALSRTDDTDRYLWSCLMYRTCVITGKKNADIHHCTGSRIGMGGNRRKVSNANRELIALSREWHEKVHVEGEEAIFEKYKIHGIILDKETLEKLNISDADIT